MYVKREKNGGKKCKKGTGFQRKHLNFRRIDSARRSLRSQPRRKIKSKGGDNSRRRLRAGDLSEERRRSYARLLNECEGRVKRRRGRGGPKERISPPNQSDVGGSKGGGEVAFAKKEPPGVEKRSNGS